MLDKSLLVSENQMEKVKPKVVKFDEVIDICIPCVIQFF